MSFIFKNPIRKAKNSLSDSVRDLARIGTLAGSGYAYGVSEAKVQEYEGTNDFLEWLTDCPFIYGSDISTLYNLNEAAAGAVGLTAGVYTAHRINRTMEKLLPNSPIKRNLLEAGAYFTLANLTNFLGSFGEKARESKGILEGIIFNMQDTFAMSYNTLADMVNFTDRPDIDLHDAQKMASIGALTLLGLTAGRLFGKPIEKACSYLFGNKREEYVARRITKDLKEKAKQKVRESRELEKTAKQREKLE